VAKLRSLRWASWDLFENISGRNGDGFDQIRRNGNGLVAGHCDESVLSTLIHVFLNRAEPGAAAVSP